MTQFCRRRRYLTVYLSEWSPSLTSLTAYQGRGLSHKVCPRRVFVCLWVCWCVGVQPWESVCAYVWARVCAFSNGGVQNTLCMWGVLKGPKFSFSCCAFPHLMTAVCRLEETQVLVSHCGTFFLTASFFHLLPLLLWTSGDEETSCPTIQCSPPPNQHLPPTSPWVLLHYFSQAPHVHGGGLWAQTKSQTGSSCRQEVCTLERNQTVPYQSGIANGNGTLSMAAEVSQVSMKQCALLNNVCSGSFICKTTVM